MTPRSHQRAEFRTIRVELAERSYDVLVGVGVLQLLGTSARSAFPKGTRAFLGYDSNLPRAVVDAAIASLSAAGFTTTSTSVIATEQDKSLAQLERLLGEMTASKLERAEPVVALGGGVVGDLVGFAASVYRRGVPVIQCPTTLLSMVDASVGGKTGVNLGSPTSLKKNFVGTFHQPRAVLADIATLQSLPTRELRSGLAECVKHSLLSAEFGDPGLFDWIKASKAKIVASDPATLTELVARNVAIKAVVVAGDEREEAKGDSGRALLNLGHTFGHVIEPMPGLFPFEDAAQTPLKHGEAISLGLVAALQASTQMGMVSSERAAHVKALLADLGLPIRIGGLPDAGVLLDLMTDDKKVQSGRLRLILPRSDGTCRVVLAPPPEAVKAGWLSIQTQ